MELFNKSSTKDKRNNLKGNMTLEEEMLWGKIRKEARRRSRGGSRARVGGDSYIRRIHDGYRIWIQDMDTGYSSYTLMCTYVLTYLLEYELLSRTTQPILIHL